MKLPRRNFLHLAAGAAALSAVSHIAWAQTYPSRPVRIIVGLAAGGGTDIVARLIGQWLSERLGQSFVWRGPRPMVHRSHGRECTGIMNEIRAFLLERGVAAHRKITRH